VAGDVPIDGPPWPEELLGLKARLVRAKEQTDGLKEEINRFVNSPGHRFPVEWNEERTEATGRVFFDPMPDTHRWAVLVGEVLHDLRSALNGLVWQLVIRNGDVPSRQTEFPIFLDKQRYETESVIKLRGTSDRVKDQIARMQPFTLEPEKAPDVALWLLHELNIVDKHRLVLPVVNALTKARSTPELPEGMTLSVSRQVGHGSVVTRISAAGPQPEGLHIQVATGYNVSIDAGSAPKDVARLLYTCVLETQNAIATFIGEF